MLSKWHSSYSTSKKLEKKTQNVFNWCQFCALRVAWIFADIRCKECRRLQNILPECRSLLRLTLWLLWGCSCLAFKVLEIFRIVLVVILRLNLLFLKYFALSQVYILFERKTQFRRAKQVPGCTFLKAVKIYFVLRSNLRLCPGLIKLMNHLFCYDSHYSIQAWSG